MKFKMKIDYIKIIDEARPYALDFYLKVLETLFELNSFQFYLEKHDAYEALIYKLISKDDNMYSFKCNWESLFKEMSMDIEIEKTNLSRDEATLLTDIIERYPRKKQCLNEWLQKDGDQELDLLLKYCFAMHYAEKCSKEIIAKNKLRKMVDRVKCMGFQDLIRSLKEKNDAEIKMQEALAKEEEISRAKIEERDRVIADLSHHIKNLVKSVIDPLRLCLEKEKNPAIENAIRGADLIRQMVNAMNMTSKGSFSDFAHDAKENKGQDAVKLYSVMLESLKYSIGNMFDKKYFNVFMAKYMPTRECFDNIKADWSKVSGSNEIEDILGFCRKHLFDIELKADSSINFMIGNSKGSAIKIMILFQEAILNAVKYAAFVPKDKRKIVISIDSDPQSFRLEVRNSYLPEQTVKGSGLGHIIIKNFCKLLDTEPVIVKTNNEFTLEIKFKNIWSQHENPVH